MIIETETAVYQLDMETGMLCRFPRQESVGTWADYVAELRKDQEPIPFRMARMPVVGERMQFILDIRNDGVPTLRTTTPVVSIGGAEYVRVTE